MAKRKASIRRSGVNSAIDYELVILNADMAEYPVWEACMRLRALVEISALLETDDLLKLSHSIMISGVSADGKKTSH